MDTNKVTRLEIIDHRDCPSCGGRGRVENGTESGAQCEMCYGNGFRGRDVVVYNPDVQIDLDLQDDGRTLKVFLHERSDDGLSHDEPY